MRAGVGLVAVVVVLAIVAALAKRQGTALDRQPAAGPVSAPARLQEPAALVRPAPGTQARQLQQVQEQLDALMQQRRADPEE